MSWDYQHDYDLFCRQCLDDPYPLFDALRRREPVHWCEPLKCWLVFGYDDTFAALNDARFLAGRRGIYEQSLNDARRDQARGLIDHIDLWLQSQNPPRHTRLRKLAGVAFTPRMIKNLVPRIQQLVQDRLHSLQQQAHCDFVRDFCYWVPATVICDMLGLPQNDHAQFQKWVEDLARFSAAAGPQLNDTVASADQALEHLLAYLGRIIAQRRSTPRDDVISSLVHARIDGDRLSEPELLALCAFLFIAGHETTMSLLASGTLLFLTHPDQQALFRQNPAALVDSAVEEFIRYEPPVTRATRVAAQDVPLGDRTVRQGQFVTFLLGAANRDPRRFDRPDELDIRRQPNKHLGFGWGRHFCLGAPLARLEASIVFLALAEQLPHWALAPEPHQWRHALGIRSLKSLPLVRR